MKNISKNPLLDMINNSLTYLPTPINLSWWWNLGSILGLCLIMQIITGFMLATHYSSNINDAFDSIVYIMHDVNSGWLFRFIHMNGASIYFFCLYIHIGRGLYYHSFNYTDIWVIGVFVLFLSMATAFLGYVLPWGQMSYWGAMVITNLMSAIPYLGNSIVKWLWGGYSIGNATLNRFYTIHFILPFIIVVLVVIHLYYLHLFGSNNPMGYTSFLYMIMFHPLYSIKDLLGFAYIWMVFGIICMFFPNLLNDPDNWIPANPMSTPIHIQPEWYFLFAYAILRCIPNKLGGVIALFMSIFIMVILPYNLNFKFKTGMFYPSNQLFFWMMANSFFMLTFLGMQAIEYPFINISQIYTMIYFSYFLFYVYFNKIWDKLLIKK